MGITRKAVEITRPGTAAVVTETIGMPGAGEVLVTSEWGAISPGSEGLVFRGEVPPDLTLDDAIASLGESAKLGDGKKPGEGVSSEVGSDAGDDTFSGASTSVVAGGGNGSDAASTVGAGVESSGDAASTDDADTDGGNTADHSTTDHSTTDHSTTDHSTTDHSTAGQSIAGQNIAFQNTAGVAYPLRYGYTCAGRVSHCGAGVDVSQWLGRRVFAFHPHATHLVVAVEDLIPIPDSIDTDVAPLYANAETAVTLVWDAHIAYGEAVLVLGQGIVGMLVAAIVARSGAGLVVTLEPDPERRAQAIAFLQDTPTVVCGNEDEVGAAISRYAGRYRGRYEGFDVVFELTGNPTTIDTAIDWTAFGGRVVLGSWYGTKHAPLSLGGRFHRGRINLISSQVSTIPIRLSGRFTRDRRGAITWNTLASLPTDRLARNTIALEEVPETLANLGGRAAATGRPSTTDGAAPTAGTAPDDVGGLTDAVAPTGRPSAIGKPPATDAAAPTGSPAPTARVGLADGAPPDDPARLTDRVTPTVPPAPWISINYQKEQ
jgi:2-desacetyl-2-hydroxyethyl bacteriochlorophyllide A dehydrogenase